VAFGGIGGGVQHYLDRGQVHRRPVHRQPGHPVGLGAELDPARVAGVLMALLGRLRRDRGDGAGDGVAVLAQ
jgi:hypothetical protein